MTAVVFERRCTKGLAIVAMASIIGAVQRAAVSGNNWPMRFGTSSPNKIVLNVMIVTTTVVAKIPDTG